MNDLLPERGSMKLGHIGLNRATTQQQSFAEMQEETDEFKNQDAHAISAALLVCEPAGLVADIRCVQPEFHRRLCMAGSESKRLAGEQ